MNHESTLDKVMMLELLFGAVPVRFMKTTAEENMHISTVIDNMGLHVR